MASITICDVIKAISDDKSLVLFNTIALVTGNRDTLNSSLKLTRRQYYSRMSELVNTGLVMRKSGKYFLTSFGRLVYEAQTIIGKALKAYWKLKALDSFGLLQSVGSQLPTNEYNRIIVTLLEGNDEIKEVLLRNSSNTQTETGYKNQELIVSAASD